MNFTIDPDFKRISELWPLTEEERANLKASIELDGIREPGTVWNGMLLDGHNRWEICQELAKSFPTQERKFDSRDDAMLWVLSIDESRRNLQPIDKLARIKFKRPILERKAKERQLAGLPANLPEGVGEVREQMAEEIGVSAKTCDALDVVLERGSPELVQAVREKKTSASAGAVVAKNHTPAEQTEILKAAEASGESVRKAVAKVAKAKKPTASTLFICQECNTQYTDGTECDCVTASVRSFPDEERTDAPATDGPLRNYDEEACTAFDLAPNKLNVLKACIDSLPKHQRLIVAGWFEEDT